MDKMNVKVTNRIHCEATKGRIYESIRNEYRRIQQLKYQKNEFNKDYGLQHEIS